ncbi:MAG: flavin oxidoreductase [Saprospiraceae bacterium]|nr:flavin reductase [Bacteroidia bacterium]NNE14630.1 flavin oxidoreductase [Saprospiraceae bacterium]NNL93630.1 flavin oxidoreductase [Saprospiraceae bacterium]
MRINQSEIESLDRIYRINLINSISGIKPGNLIGTRSLDKVDNVAIFSSVVHLGSNPAQFGFVLRPQGEMFSDTFQNIIDTQCYTINHIHKDLIEKSHYTSAKLGKEESEFEKMNIEKEFINDFHAPFVKMSPVKIGMKLLNYSQLPNDCYFIIGSVQMIDIQENAVAENGQINLQTCESIGISGVNTYYQLTQVESHPYVGNNPLPKFI